MFNDLKRGFWYSIGAVAGVCVLQWLTGKFIEKSEKEDKKNYVEESE